MQFWWIALKGLFLTLLQTCPSHLCRQTERLKDKNDYFITLRMIPHEIPLNIPFSGCINKLEGGEDEKLNAESS